LDKIRIGTRGSKLALWQAYFVENQLQKFGFQTEIVIISTKGDEILSKSIAKIGSKGVFTVDLENRLRDGQIDIAVHSAKDMQSHLDPDMMILAYCEREKPNDVIVSYNKYFSLEQKHDLIVGTSSTRRVALLKHYYPHMRTANVRGNLQTRMKRLEEGICDALLLAYAGVKRMEMDKHIVSFLPLEEFTPPAGQGAIAIECAKDLPDHLKSKLFELLNHAPTQACIEAERAFLYTLHGGCSVPVFAYASLSEDLKTLDMQAGVCQLDGKTIIKASGKTTYLPENQQSWQDLGNQLAQQAIDQGALEILKEIKG